MTNNKSKIKLTFYFEPVNGSYMSLKVIGENKIIPVDNVGSVVLERELPTEIILLISGKNMHFDTVLKDNEIIADKHIKLVGCTIDRIKIQESFLKHWPEFDGNKDSYFGFNGKVVLKIDEADSFTWCLKTLKTD